MSCEKVINLDERRGSWLAAVCGCGVCGTLWVGVCHELRTHALECPVCGEMTGVAVEDVAIDVDGLEELRESEPERFYEDTRMLHPLVGSDRPMGDDE